MTARKIVRTSLLAAGAGLVMLAIGLAVDASRAWIAYLNAWTFGVTICLGALLLLMAGHAAKASWMVVTRRLTESIVAALPIYLILFVPFFFVLAAVYPWAAPTAAVEPGLRQAIEHKRVYLNPPFFIIRTVVYFAIFIAIGALLRAWSSMNDRRPSRQLVVRMRRLGGGGLPLVGLTLTWASFDWTMSLQPDWSSTIFGLYYFAGSFVGAIALVAVMLHLSRLRPDPGASVTPDHAQALGRLLFAMVIFWAYIAFSQLLIYWIGDIPEEVSFFVLRSRGSWSGITWILVCGMFIVPFFALLNRHLKRRTEYLAAVATWIFFMHYVDVYWMVLPVHDTHGVRPHWLDLGAALFVGGLSCAWIARSYFRVPPLPEHVPELAHGLEYEAAV